VNKDLTIISKNGQLLVDSRDVAEMTEKDHSNLMRDMRGYIDVLNDPDSNLKAANFFYPKHIHGYSKSIQTLLPSYS
jgi:phage regulator Rha-like protein